MRALQLQEWGGPLVPVELAVPEPGPQELRLRVRTCGVGDTLNNMRGGRNRSMPGASLPRVIGHEVAGVVDAIGAGVVGWETGQRAYVYMYLTCGRCEACRWGHDPLCRSMRGMVWLAIDGGFADYLVVPAANVGPLPDEVDDLAACVAVDALATPWHALQAVARLRATDTLVVIGAGGGVGIHAVMVGAMMGARVLAVDITPEKIAFAIEHGADEAIDGTGDVAGAVMELTGGRGADVIVDYVASSATLAPAFEALAPDGRLVIQGVNPPGDEFSVTPRSFVHRQVSVAGSRYASRREVAEAIELVRRGTIRPVVSRTAPLGEAGSLFRLIADRTLLGRAAVVISEPP
jgi:D-arabinose 1-dehydrogenase-like Zn-dependent alcohol dehydrogenase